MKVFPWHFLWIFLQFIICGFYVWFSLPLALPPLLHLLSDHPSVFFFISLFHSNRLKMLVQPLIVLVAVWVMICHKMLTFIHFYAVIKSEIVYFAGVVRGIRNLSWMNNANFIQTMQNNQHIFSGFYIFQFFGFSFLFLCFFLSFSFSFSSS